MLQQVGPKAILFLDFDGTISRSDAVDDLLAAYADQGWLRLEEEWRAGRMGSRDCLRAQIALVKATPKQINALMDKIEIDEGVVELLQMCAIQDVPVHILSDGFESCIRRILTRPVVAYPLYFVVGGFAQIV